MCSDHFAIKLFNVISSKNILPVEQNYRIKLHWKTNNKATVHQGKVR